MLGINLTLPKSSHLICNSDLLTDLMSMLLGSFHHYRALFAMYPRWRQTRQKHLTATC